MARISGLSEFDEESTSLLATRRLNQLAHDTGLILRRPWCWGRRRVVVEDRFKLYFDTHTGAKRNREARRRLERRIKAHLWGVLPVYGQSSANAEAAAMTRKVDRS